MRFLKKLKIELPYDSAIPLLGIYPELWESEDDEDDSSYHLLSICAPGTVPAFNISISSHHTTLYVAMICLI